MPLDIEQSKTQSPEELQFDIKNSSDVTVIIAARNEEKSIARTLNSLLEQPGVSQIIVVNDHSTDKTPEVVSEISHNNSTIKLLHAPPMPDEWTGKTHALYIGSKEASSEFILFTDADVIFKGDIIKRMLTKMHSEDIDHVGGLFGLECHTIAEKISGPVLSSFGRLSMKMTAKKLGAGTGAFNLVRKSVYQAAGGHLTISGKVVDDVELARLIHAYTRKTIFVPETSKDVKVRLYEGWRGYWNAIARSAVPFLSGSRLFSIILSLPFMALALFLCVSPLLAIMNIWFILPYALFYFLLNKNKSHCDTNWFWMLFYPIPFLLMVICVLFTAIRFIFKSEINWRGRQYNVLK